MPAVISRHFFLLLPLILGGCLTRTEKKPLFYLNVPEKNFSVESLVFSNKTSLLKDIQGSLSGAFPGVPFDLMLESWERDQIKKTGKGSFMTLKVHGDLGFTCDPMSPPHTSKISALTYDTLEKLKIHYPANVLVKGTFRLSLTWIDRRCQKPVKRLVFTAQKNVPLATKASDGEKREQLQNMALDLMASIQHHLSALDVVSYEGAPSENSL